MLSATRVLSLGLILAVVGCASSTTQLPREPAARRLVPNEPADDLRLPVGTTYFAFARDVKEALDRDFEESARLGNFRSRRGREAIIAGGGGVYVRLQGPSYNIHMGYTPTTDNGGENSGRSYGVGPTRGGKPDDLSYPDLFGDLEEYAQATPDMSDFYRTFFQILLSCDASGMRGLSPEGQTLMSDLISVYGAEMNRNIMSGLKKFDWQKHLGDVTMLAAFHAETGLAWAADEGQLKRGPLEVFIGHGTEGSGVGGKGGIERRRFQRSLTAALRSTNRQGVARIEAIIGKQTDIFHGLMEAVNRDRVRDSDELIDAVVDLLKDLRDNGSQIAAKVKASSDR